jgi:hypothetical protein
MKKLKLNVEELAVDSFELANIEESRGTVHGNEPTDGCSQYCTPTIFEYIWYQTWKQER